MYVYIWSSSPYTLRNDGEGGASISGSSWSVLRCISKHPPHLTKSHFDLRQYLTVNARNAKELVVSKIKNTSVSSCMIYYMIRIA